MLKNPTVPKYNSLSNGGGNSNLFSVPAFPLFLEYNEI